METAVRKIVEERDNEILYKIQSALGVDVDRGELMRALQYDRNQYEKGYADGKADAMAEIVRCKDCVRWQRHTHVDRERGHCRRFDLTKHEFGFCDRGERRTDAETD
jgi:hypothetical protein